MQTAVTLRPSLWRVGLVALPAALAIWGQWALYSQKLVADGVILFSISAAVFAIYVLPHQQLILPAIESVPGTTRRLSNRGSVVAVSCVALFTGLSWLFSDGNRLRPETVVFWVLSVASFMWLFWESKPTGREAIWHRIARSFARPVSVPWSAIAFTGVMLIAAFFRFYQLGTIPSEMTSDHAEKLLDIQDVLNGQYRIFFPRNTGRELLQFYMEIPYVAAFGLGHLALKGLTATISLLTVAVVFFIGREIGGTRFALLAAFFLAVSKWDVGIGRMGLRFPYYPLFASLTFYFLLRALRRGERNSYLLCGLAMGVGAYGYTPFRITPLLVAAAVLVKLGLEVRKRPGEALATLKSGLLCAGTSLVVFVPLAHYMTENPQTYWFRALSRVSSLESPIGPNPLTIFASNLVNGLLMFNWRGDNVWITTVPGDPALDYISGGLFVLGLVWCVTALLRDRNPVAAYLLLGLIVFMLPSVTSIAFPAENPSLSRSGGNTVIAALLIAAPVYLMAQRLAQEWPGAIGRQVSALLLVALLVLVARTNFDRYFIDYPVQYRQAARNSSEMASVISGFDKSVGSRQRAYLKDWPHWVDTRNVAFNLGDPTWNNVLHTEEEITEAAMPPGSKLYLVNRADQEAIRRLKERFPEGQLKEQKTIVPEQSFLVYFVPGAP